MHIFDRSSDLDLNPSPVLLLARAESSSNSEACFGLNCGNQWVWGRWILLVFFLCFIAGLALTAIKFNGKRTSRGERPIPGTAWFTPPTYRQSERTNRSSTQDYVPPYTERANANDLGFYDDQGVFHFNKSAEETPPPPLDPSELASETIQRPAPAAVRSSTTTVLPSTEFEEDFNRYYYGTTASAPRAGPLTDSSTSGPVRNS